MIYDKTLTLYIVFVADVLQYFVQRTQSILWPRWNPGKYFFWGNIKILL